MTMQRLCHSHTRRAVVAVIGSCALCTASGADAPTHDYPTHARVEFVQECIATHGSKLSALYQCSCVIDKIAEKLAYDDFVEAATYSKYANLPGEGGALFRDSEQARSLAKLYRDTTADAERRCGLTS